MTVSAYATTARARTRGGAPPQRRTSTLQRCPNASTVLTVLHPVHPAMDLITIRNEKKANAPRAAHRRGAGGHPPTEHGISPAATSAVPTATAPRAVNASILQMYPRGSLVHHGHNMGRSPGVAGVESRARN